MRRAGWLGLAAFLVFCRGAHADGAACAPCRCPEPASAEAQQAEELEFEARLTRFARLWEFTQRLVFERSQREFEREAERQVRVSEFAEKLEQRREREFEEEVALAVKKLEFTRSLVERRAR